MADSTHPDPAVSTGEISSRVTVAAQWAWKAHGEDPGLFRTPINERAHMNSLKAERARRLEFIVESDDPDAWETLSALEPDQHWQLCALVPLHLLGVAHDRLRARSFELQGWWVSGGKVTFGNVEIA